MLANNRPTTVLHCPLPLCPSSLRSPCEFCSCPGWSARASRRTVAFAKERGWRNLKLYSDTTGEFSRDYHALTAEGGDDAAYNVFTRRDGAIRHFWSGEMGFDSADPGQDPRGAPDLMPIWTILDSTPEGRGTDWYPKLEYGK